ncbi:hypothetical protein [Halohasta salina]|uniref:hypothetical protein n=1 Tax=Halohasta salina TaxID=2961621 RepID=UPI0020A24B3F|nr:hypothetical protein [Halohasta salina]
MYESTFSTDWSELDRDEAVERAYALGVASAFGDPHREEYEAIKAAAGSSYDRSLIELAHDQGRSQALQLEAASTDTAPEEVWGRLVESAPVDLPEPEGGLPDVLGPTALLDRIDHLEGPPSTLRKPSFLSRDDRDNV